MAKTLYAPLNGVSDEVKKILVSTGGLSDYVVKGYCSVGGLSKLFFNGGKKAETIIYYSDNNTQYVYDKSSGTWNNKTWSGNLKPIDGYYIWTDGTNIYFSYFNEQYVLDISTDTWNIKTWNGFTPERGFNIWTDGDNVYYSNSSSQYVLNKSTSTWSVKTWYGFAPEAGSNIWTDGTNIYYSSNNNQYVLNKSTSTWSVKTWNGFTMLLGQYIWTDGTNIYYSNVYPHYILNKETNTWSEVTFNILGSAFSGTQIWSDGDNVYYSDSSSQFVLDKTTRTWNAKTWGTLYPNDGTKVWKIVKQPIPTYNIVPEYTYVVNNTYQVHNLLTPQVTLDGLYQYFDRIYSSSLSSVTYLKEHWSEIRNDILSYISSFNTVYLSFLVNKRSNQVNVTANVGQNTYPKATVIASQAFPRYGTIWRINNNTSENIQTTHYYNITVTSNSYTADTPTSWTSDMYEIGLYGAISDNVNVTDAIVLSNYGMKQA